MDTGTVAGATVLFYCLNAIVTVDYADIMVAVVMVITVYKLIIASFDSVASYSVARQDIHLHSVVSHEKIPLSFHNRVI